MSIEETRQLGIEFERRIQTMIPEKEFDKLDTETIYSFLNQYQDKYVHDIYRSLDQIPSGTKLSAHVEAVLQAMLDDVEIKTDEGAIDMTDSAIEDPNGVIMDTGRSIIYPLPETFYMYVRSVSNVTETFSFKSSTIGNNYKIRIVPNELVSQNDVWKLIETPHNSLRILRHPAAVLSKKQTFSIPTGNNIYTFQDRSRDIPNAPEADFTVVGENTGAIIPFTLNNGIISFTEAQMVTYIGQSAVDFIKNQATDGSVFELTIPGHDFQMPCRIRVNVSQEIQNYQRPSITVIYDQYTTPLGIKVLFYKEPAHFDLMTSTPCELPMDVFDDLISGAVDLYVQYVAGAEARKKQMQEAARQQQKENNKRRNNEED